MPRKRPTFTVHTGDCRDVISSLDDESLDVVVTSPPYWGQRMSNGTGVEDDPRDYVASLVDLFVAMKPKMKPTGIFWLNVGDAYNTPVNWSGEDRKYSSLGADKAGLSEHTSAYVKPRHKRKAFTKKDVPWLTYGNLLALPYRIVEGLCDEGFLYRGEVIWNKSNPMPEGRCRRPHRQHESIYLLAVDERHEFRVSPPVGSVWNFGSEKIDGLPHYSRFPLELPLRCIDALGRTGSDVVVFDPFTGSGTTGIAALMRGCSFIGSEIEADQAQAARERMAATLASGSKAAS